jgi:hypothetical protein
MALSSDELVKRELIDSIGYEYFGYEARVFPEGSNQDQKKYFEGGLTFTYDNTDYGSCDLAYIDTKDINKLPFIAIEGTDALNRGSSGNAQYQRFHHALGAVKNGFIGIYYLRPGNLEVQKDLYSMAYHSTKTEKGFYIITQDIKEIKEVLRYGRKSNKLLVEFLNNLIFSKYKIFLESFEKRYKNDWESFAEKRSTIIYDRYLIKYSARNILNFTDGSQRAGHIAVGEMYLTKYFFPHLKFYYLWPRMTKVELESLNTSKKNDKEWNLLSTESNVSIKTIDDLIGLPDLIRSGFMKISKDPLKRNSLLEFNSLIKELRSLIIQGKVTLIED